VLDPTANSIAYAVTLRIRIGAAIERKNLEQLRPGNSLWNKLVLFLESFDPVQMRYAGHEWRKLIDYVEQIARATGTVRIQSELWKGCPSHNDRLDVERLPNKPSGTS